MDKRLLKSLTTAKTRYESKIAEYQNLLMEVNSMIASLGSQQDVGKTSEVVPPMPKPVVHGFIGKKGETHD